MNWLHRGGRTGRREPSNLDFRFSLKVGPADHREIPNFNYKAKKLILFLELFWKLRS